MNGNQIKTFQSTAELYDLYSVLGNIKTCSKTQHIATTVNPKVLLEARSFEIYTDILSQKLLLYTIQRIEPLHELLNVIRRIGNTPAILYNN